MPDEVAMSNPCKPRERGDWAGAVVPCLLVALIGVSCASERSAGTTEEPQQSSRDARSGRRQTNDTAPADSGVDMPTATDSASDQGGPVESDTADEPDLPREDTSLPPPDVYTGPVGGVSGTVWAPGNAPGMVPEGQEIPITGALVYLSYRPAESIPERVYCEYCEEPGARAVYTDPLGNFHIPDYPPGTYYLIMQKGQFRRQLEVEVEADVIRELSVEDTTLPNVHDPENGLWTPRMAVAVGSFDQLEDILGKMGFGEVGDDGEYIPESVPDRVDFYENGGSGFSDVTVGTLADLATDLERMLDYHIIFIPCSGSSNTHVLRNQSTLRNIRDYVKEGGKLYVTDWSGEWADNVFPASIQLGGLGIDTPAFAYNAATDTWRTLLFGSADGSAYDTPNAEAVVPELRAWLDEQTGPTVYDETPSEYDASHFEVEGNWNVIRNLVTTEVGTAPDGTTIYDEPVPWVIGGSDILPIPKNPLTVTYEPVGCGRVLFSTYHTTDDVHVGLVPQERVLLHLIMEITVCRDVKWE